MGKRSGFEKIPRDFYSTWDPRAVAPLLPHLPPHTRYAEPCCGEFALVRLLEKAGHSCYWASDIEDRWSAMASVAGSGVQFKANVADALILTVPLQQSDMIITNPPFSKTVLFPMIEHFRKQNVAWLLLPADFAHNVGSGDYMKYCSKIVSIGRVRWIPGTSAAGKENFAWFRFERDPCDTIFIGRGG